MWYISIILTMISFTATAEPVFSPYSFIMYGREHDGAHCYDYEGRDVANYGIGAILFKNSNIELHIKGDHTSCIAGRDRNVSNRIETGVVYYFNGRPVR